MLDKSGERKSHPSRQESRTTQFHNLKELSETTNQNLFLFEPVCYVKGRKDKNALLSRMRWRNEIHSNDETLCMQELRTLSHPSRAYRAKTATTTKARYRQRRSTKSKKRIPEMVARQEEIETNALHGV